MFASMFSKLDAPRMGHEQRMLGLKSYMRGTFLPKELQERVLYYHEFLWTREGGMD